MKGEQRLCRPIQWRSYEGGEKGKEGEEEKCGTRSTANIIGAVGKIVILNLVLHCDEGC